MVLCPVCNKEVEPSKGKRPRIYCSDNCNKRAYYKRTPKEQERCRKYAKEYRLKNRELFAKKASLWRQKNRDKSNAYMRKYMLDRYYKHTPEERERANSRKRICNKYKNGVVIKDKCSVCGSVEKLEFHHLDYEKDVTLTLCLKCHRTLHRRISL